jgi:hypothetical protein
MANQEHLDILAKGVEEWNRWRVEFPKAEPDLSRVDLSRIELPNANLKFVSFRATTLTRAVLCGSNLHGADLYQAEFYRADLSAAELDGSDLRGAKLHDADLTSASLERTQLFRVDFIQTAVRRTRFEGAICGLTTFANVDLREAIGLEKVVHSGPSNLDISTLLRSVRDVPKNFFVSAGIPEPFIRHVLAYRSSPEQFLSCFISYSTSDQEFADRLYTDLQARGVRCWFAPHDIQGGRKTHEQIDDAIRIYDKLLLILSDASMSSPWVKTEIANARAREEQQKRQMLFPITLAPFDRIQEWKLFDADRGIDSAREIREYFIPDFSDWKDHDSYQKAFERLLRDLKSGALEVSASEASASELP